MTQQAASPGFDKLAADFFSGREVRENYTFVQGLNAPITTNYRITYNNQNTISAAIWEEMHNSPAFARFIIDISLCNDIESHRSRGFKWQGAKVVKSGAGDIKSLVEVLKDLQKVHKPSKSVDRNTDELTILPNRGLCVMIIEDRETTSVGESPLPSKAYEDTTAEGNLENGDDWMVLDQKREMEKNPKRSSEKLTKRRKRRAKKVIQTESAFVAGNHDESPSPPTLELLEGTQIRGSTTLEEEKGEWDIVSKKAAFCPGRSVGGLSNDATKDRTGVCYMLFELFSFYSNQL